MQCKATGLRVISLIDLTATKLKTIQQRAEAKDYLNLDAGVTLEKWAGGSKGHLWPRYSTQ
jgi:predicted nucleotidyltransferase component of viral defense system